MCCEAVVQRDLLNGWRRKNLTASLSNSFCLKKVKVRESCCIFDGGGSWCGDVGATMKVKFGKIAADSLCWWHSFNGVLLDFRSCLISFFVVFFVYGKDLLFIIIISLLRECLLIFLK